MTPHPAVLIGLREREFRDRLEGWVRRLGYDARTTADGSETLAWVREGSFVASFLDSGLGAPEGETVWRVVRPIVGRRLVLMAWERSNDLWFEALRSGVGTVLPLPPEEPMVRAALAAVARPFAWGDGGGRGWAWKDDPDAEHQAAER
jgi:hypothetical protein